MDHTPLHSFLETCCPVLSFTEGGCWVIRHYSAEGQHESACNENNSGRRYIHLRFPHSPIRIRSGLVMLRKEAPADDMPIRME